MICKMHQKHKLRDSKNCIAKCIKNTNCETVKIELQNASKAYNCENSKKWIAKCIKNTNCETVKWIAKCIKSTNCETVKIELQSASKTQIAKQ